MPVTPFSWRSFACLTFLLIGTGLQIGGGQEAASDQELQKKWYAFYEADAATSYSIREPGGSSPLSFERKPILRWTNPLEDGQIHGAAYVWSKGDRPVVIGQLFSYLNGRGGRVYCHAFHSLADGPLEGARNGKVFWTPKEKGLEFQPLATADPPAKTPSKRLLQMRDIARRVSAYTEEMNRGKRVLRLMPQPLYRYRERKGSSDDGAVFALVVGNDPEVLLVVETVDSPFGPQWQYGFARSTRSQCVAHFDRKEVWRYEQGNRPPENPSNTYLSVHGIATLPLEPLAIDEQPR